MEFFRDNLAGIILNVYLFFSHCCLIISEKCAENASHSGNVLKSYNILGASSYLDSNNSSSPVKIHENLSEGVED